MRTNCLKAFGGAFRIGVIKADLRYAQAAGNRPRCEELLEEMKQIVAADKDPLPEWEKFLASYELPE